MKNRSLVIGLSLVILLILIVGSFSAGVVAARTLPIQAGASPFDLPIFGFGRGMAKSALEEAPGNETKQGLDELFRPFWQAWEIVHKEYVDQPIDDVILMRGAISGMLQALGDEHTSYLEPKQFESLSSQLKGDYEGIGAWVDTTGDYLKIVSPMPGSPAEEAGLKAGDIVIAVDGEDMTGIDGELVRQKVLGPKGTKVRLTIVRENVKEPFDVVIERRSIVVPSVDGRMLDNNIAYVQVITFGEKTAPDLRATLKKLLDQNPNGLILDLRNNGGGYLETGIQVVSEFIEGGKLVMIEEFGNGKRKEFKAESGGLATKIPLVVLINQGSASASEIVAGAIQDTGRGILVGVTSYGKGSVQTFTPLVNNQGAIRVTIARWLTPSGKQINKQGLTPDIVVELSDEDLLSGKDPQLEKAVEYLLK